MEIPASHPRKASLDLRHRLTEGFAKGFVASAGLIAHGRGEAFDYLLGERTCVHADKAQETASALLLLAENPVLSVNGNVCALCPGEVVSLAKVVSAKVEINLFYRSVERIKLIRDVLLGYGADEVYGVGVGEKTIPGLDSERGRADVAQVEADVVLVMLEDGDRAEALKSMGKKVVAVDLNPLSRTAQMADISIVDNVVRALPNMIEYAKKLKNKPDDELKSLVDGFDNRLNLAEMEKLIRVGSDTV
ncbi:MAG: phosphopantothenate/pantothenate synthetase [Candidatus Altiarchaeota archaeon]|nr:phosphopantothenate/pantothenate synthetase [Candidatus Altiarchaeota archaeon]